jgi:hypothetical protein
LHGGVVTSKIEELPHWQVVHLLEDSVGLPHAMQPSSGGM